MGRPRKPTEQLKLHGGYREDRHGGDEPIASGDATQVYELEGDALDLWEHLVPKLRQSGLAKSIDSAELTALCHWWGEYRKWSKETDIDDYKRMVAMATAYKQFRTIASRFGMTPSDRAGLRIPEEKKTKVASRKRA